MLAPPTTPFPAEREGSRRGPARGLGWICSESTGCLPLEHEGQLHLPGPRPPVALCRVLYLRDPTTSQSVGCTSGFPPGSIGGRHGSPPCARGAQLLSRCRATEEGLGTVAHPGSGVLGSLHAALSLGARIRVLKRRAPARSSILLPACLPCGGASLPLAPAVEQLSSLETGPEA